MEHVFNGKVTVSKFTKFVVPSVIMMFFISLYTIVDGIFVSNLVGENALASINIVYPINGFSFGISVMLATGSSAIVAIKRGEGKIQESNEKFTLICMVSALFGIVCCAIALFFLVDIVRLLGATPTLFEDCITYGRVMILALPVVILGTLFEYYIRVDGKPVTTMMLYISGGVVNIILDYVFMYHLGMGIFGAALATFIGLVVVMVIGFIYFIFTKSNLRFTKPKWDLKYILHSMVNGSSEMFTECSLGIITIVFNLIALSFAGEHGVAALTIVMYAHFLLVSTYLGFVNGVAPLVSYHFGALKFDIIKILLKYSKVFILTSSIAIFIIAEIGAPVIVRVFTDPTTQVYDLALTGLRLVAVCFLFVGINVFASGLFTAYANGLISGMISLARSLVFVVIGAMILPPLFGINGIWLSLPFAEALTLIISLGFFKKYRKVYHY